MMSRKAFEESLRQPVQFWSEKSSEDVCTMLCAEAALMVGYNQRNPHHCYDLFMHTLHTVENLGNESPDALRIAAFFHDIGKPQVAMKKQGRLVFYGHAQKSAEIAESILCDLGYASDEIELICFYIRHHDDFISWVLPSEQYDHNNPYLIEITADNVSAHISKVMAKNAFLMEKNIYVIWTNLLSLCRADASAQAEYVYRDEVIIDSKEHKLKKVEAIDIIVKDIYS